MQICLLAVECLQTVAVGLETQLLVDSRGPRTSWTSVNQTGVTRQSGVDGLLHIKLGTLRNQMLHNVPSKIARKTMNFFQLENWKTRITIFQLVEYKVDSINKTRREQIIETGNCKESVEVRNKQFKWKEESTTIE